MRIPPHARGQPAAVNCSVALVCALLWQPSAAQTVMSPDAASVTNPAAKVPALSYRSVFKETTLGVEKDSEDWRKANDSVGKFMRGHVDILKWEEQESTKAMEKSAMEKPAMPQPVGAKAPKPETIKPIAAPVHKH